MSEEIEDKIQNIFDWESYYRKNKALRDLDIFISEHLFKKPCVAWAWIDNNDGDDIIYPNETWRDERQKEPLYLLSEEDFYEDYKDFESFCESNKQYSDGSEKDLRYIKERWDEESVNGVHRRNLKKIPEYSKDLNLIRRCEEKLKELDLEEQYGQSLECEISISIHNGGDIVSLNGWKDLFKIINCDAETKAKAIVRTLKYTQEKEKWLKKD